MLVPDFPTLSAMTNFVKTCKTYNISGHKLRQAFHKNFPGAKLVESPENDPEKHESVWRMEGYGGESIMLFCYLNGKVQIVHHENC
jgi:hypothetical protein